MHGSFCAVQVRNNSAMSTLGIFRDRVQESSAGAAQGDDSVRIQLRLANDQGIITCLSRPFSIDYKRYSFPLRLRAAGCAGGDAGDAGGDADPPVPYEVSSSKSSPWTQTTLAISLSTTREKQFACGKPEARRAL
jgi:hypothetical protein